MLDGDQLLRVGHLQQAELKMEALLLLVSQFTMSAQHDLQVASEIFFGEHFCYSSDALAFFAGDLEQRGIFARDFGDGGIAQETYHLSGKVGGAVPLAD